MLTTLKDTLIQGQRKKYEKVELTKSTTTRDERFILNGKKEASKGTRHCEKDMEEIMKGYKIFHKKEKRYNKRVKGNTIVKRKKITPFAT